MAYFAEWNGYLSVNVSDMDDRHKRLIGIANRLYNARLEGRSLEVETDAMDELSGYGRDELGKEEALMIEKGYLDFSRHEAMHDQFRAEIKRCFSLKKEGAAVTDQILDFLKKWLMGHVLKADKELGLFLNSKGIT